MKGFTLIEIIIALSLVVIACLIAIPSFMQRGTELKGVLAKAQLLEQLQQAQQIANTNTTGVKVCLSSDGASCVTDHATMILMLVDDKLITSAYVKGRGTLHLRSYPAYHNYISVLPTVIGKSDNGTFWYCSNDNILQWAVTVSQSGEPQTILATDGVIDSLPGGKLAC